MRKNRVRLIHWKATEAADRAEIIRSAGYDVLHEAFGPAAFKEMRKSPPDAVVIDLTRLPSHGRDVGLGVRQYKDTRLVPLVFVEGEPAKVQRVRELLPDAVYTSWDRILQALEEAIAHPPQKPVVPSSAMAGYEGAPLPKKLGIKHNAVVYFIDAPEDFEKSMNDLPEGVTFVRKEPKKNDLAVWFVRSQRELAEHIDGVKKAIGKGGLWIAWPKKSSGTESDLSQQSVRKRGLAAGLVDYKVCSIDETWSGLKFRVRSKK
jgi:hypothetical protein